MSSRHIVVMRSHVRPNSNNGGGRERRRFQPVVLIRVPHKPYHRPMLSRWLYNSLCSSKSLYYPLYCVFVYVYAYFYRLPHQEGSKLSPEFWHQMTPFSDLTFLTCLHIQVGGHSCAGTSIHSLYVPVWTPWIINSPMPACLTNHPSFIVVFLAYDFSPSLRSRFSSFSYSSNCIEYPNQATSHRSPSRPSNFESLAEGKVDAP